MKKIELNAGTSENLELLTINVILSSVKIFKCGQSAGKTRKFK